MALPAVVVSGQTTICPGSVWRSHAGIVKKQTMPDDTDRPTEWAATSAYAWGRGYSEEQAIMQLCSNESIDPDRERPVTVAIWKVYVDDWEKIGPAGIDADEPLRFKEWELDPADVAEVQALYGKIDRATEDMLIHGDVTRRQDLDPDTE